MAGKRGLVMGVANDHSIAWGIAQMLAAQGAEIAFTYQGEAQKKRLTPLAASVGSEHRAARPMWKATNSWMPSSPILEKQWGTIDFLVHAIAFSDREELKGRYVDTSRANFAQQPGYFLLFLHRRGAARGTADAQWRRLVTLTYLGAQRVMPNYNVMGVAKAALEASVRYLAADLGKDNIRVNAISAGPMRTLAGSAVGDARMVFKWNKSHSPLKQNGGA